MDEFADWDYCDWCGDWLAYCTCMPDGWVCSKCGKIATLDCRTPH